jgi:PAS domain-containing protein
LEQRNKSIFGYEKHQVGDSSKWWFDNIHPETASKCLLNYILYRTKNDNWQDEYRFKCADNSYKYVLDRGFLLKDENGKAIRMIRPSKISQSKRRRAAT